LKLRLESLVLRIPSPHLRHHLIDGFPFDVRVHVLDELRERYTRENAGRQSIESRVASRILE
jgi:hypothetical protein